MRTMRTALKGIGMIAIAASIFFTACGDPKNEDTTTGSDTINEPAPNPAPIDTNAANAPVDTVKAAAGDSIKK